MVLFGERDDDVDDDGNDEDDHGDVDKGKFKKDYIFGEWVIEQRKFSVFTAGWVGGCLQQTICFIFSPFLTFSYQTMIMLLRTCLVDMDEQIALL